MAERFPPDKIAQHHDWQRVSYRAFLQMVCGRSLPAYSQTSGVYTAAYINHGRWVADCPYGDGGSLVIEIAQPYFWCKECGNAEANGRWHEIIVPSHAARTAIEQELLGRGRQANRNWLPGETLAALRREGRAHV